MAGESALAIIEKLGLERHPEGGWFRETWRADARQDDRATATAIYFLLEQDDRSHWHKVDAEELWLWHAGSQLTLSIARDEGSATFEVMLGPDVLAGHVPQALVPTGHWQAAAPNDGWTLVSCVVSPGFEFSGFELAPEGWEPGGIQG